MMINAEVEVWTSPEHRIFFLYLHPDVYVAGSHVTNMSFEKSVQRCKSLVLFPDHFAGIQMQTRIPLQTSGVSEPSQQNSPTTHLVMVMIQHTDVLHAAARTSIQKDPLINSSSSFIIFREPNGKNITVNKIYIHQTSVYFFFFSLSGLE